MLGVDVDARMAQSARRRGVDVEVAPFETWDPAGRTFDAVVAGQTWHWVDPVAGTAKAAEVLRPRGRLAVFWNGGDAPAELAEAFAAVYRRLLPDLPMLFTVRSAVDGYRGFLSTAEEAIRQTAGFGEPERRQYPWEQTYTRARLGRPAAHERLLRADPAGHRRRGGGGHRRCCRRGRWGLHDAVHDRPGDGGTGSDPLSR